MCQGHWRSWSSRAGLAKQTGVAPKLWTDRAARAACKHTLHQQHGRTQGSCTASSSQRAAHSIAAAAAQQQHGHAAPGGGGGGPRPPPPRWAGRQGCSQKAAGASQLRGARADPWKAHRVQQAEVVGCDVDGHWRRRRRRFAAATRASGLGVAQRHEGALEVLQGGEGGPKRPKRRGRGGRGGGA
jgi:hypothetical protein